MATGAVKWFNASKGDGYITPEGGVDDVFVQHRAILISGYKTLAVVQKLTLDTKRGAKGPGTVNVIPL